MSNNKNKNTDFSNKCILVTGGAGYIGSSLSSLLVDNGYKVVVVDNSSFSDEILSGIKNQPNFKLVRGDITSEKLVKTIFSDYRISTVIHLAAVVGDLACAKRPELAEAVNWQGSLKLLNYSIKSKVEKFIFSSTCSNYGRMSNTNGYLDETSPLAPISLYAELKVKFENFIINEIRIKKNICPVALRFATGYGISPRMRFDLTVNEFTKELALGRELEVFGEHFWRPYCHVYDLAKAVLLTLDSDKERIAYHAFNVGHTDENYQKQMIVEEIRKFIPDAKVRYVKKDEDPRDYRVSFKKIKDELGFATLKKLPDGIKEIKDSIDDKTFLNPDDIKYRNS